MRAKLDENLPVEAVELLRAAGWECDTVYDEGLAGGEDPKVASACQAGARVLFTLDLDFADIRAYPPNEYVGIVVLRPAEARNGSSIGSGSWRRLAFAYGGRTSQRCDNQHDWLRATLPIQERGRRAGVGYSSFSTLGASTKSSISDDGAG